MDEQYLFRVIKTIFFNYDLRIIKKCYQNFYQKFQSEEITNAIDLLYGRRNRSRFLLRFRNQKPFQIEIKIVDKPHSIDRVFQITSIQSCFYAFFLEDDITSVRKSMIVPLEKINEINGLIFIVRFIQNVAKINEYDYLTLRPIYFQSDRRNSYYHIDNNEIINDYIKYFFKEVKQIL